MTEPPPAGDRPADRPPALLALLLVFAFLLFTDAPGSWLGDPDESRYASVARGMLDSGDFVTPRLNGTRYFEKPPLLYWAEAASFAVLGPTDFAARLPARLATLGTAALLVRVLGGAAGLWSALVFLSAPLVFAVGRTNLTDGPLSFCLALAFLSLRGFLLTRERGGRGRILLAGLGAACGAAVLAKGLVGVVLPGLALLAWAAITGKWARVREAVLSPAPLVFLAVAAPWFVLVERANPGFSEFFFVDEHLRRYATDAAHRDAPFWFLAAVFTLGFLPWTALLPSALSRLGRFRLADLRRAPDDLFLFLWVAVLVAFFSASRSKLPPYVLPAMPAAAMLVGRAVAREGFAGGRLLPVLALLFTVGAGAAVAWTHREGILEANGLGTIVPAGAILLCAGAWTGAVLGRRDGRAGFLAFAAGMAAVSGTALLAYPRAVRERCGHDLAVAAARQEGALVACYATFTHSLPWVLGRPVVVVNYRGEHASDGVRPTNLYWEKDEFWRRWNSPERIVAYVGRRRPAFDRLSARPPVVLAESGGYALLANFASEGR